MIHIAQTRNTTMEIREELKKSGTELISLDQKASQNAFRIIYKDQNTLEMHASSEVCYIQKYGKCGYFTNSGSGMNWREWRRGDISEYLSKTHNKVFMTCYNILKTRTDKIRCMSFIKLIPEITN